MSKYTWLFVMVFITTVITLVANQIETLALVNEVGNTLPTETGLGSGTIRAFLSTYWGLLTFNVEGIPVIVSLFFVPLNLVSGFILAELVIKALDLIPFT